MTFLSISKLSVVAASLSFMALAQPVFSQDEDADGDGPDYYEGQDAPMNLGPDPAAINARYQDSKDPEESTTGPLWMELAGEGSFSTQQNAKTAAQSAFRIGWRFFLPPPVSLDAYALTRFDRDQRNLDWNNHVDAGGGLRLGFSRKVRVTLASEFVGGEYLRSSYTPYLRTSGGLPTGFYWEFRSFLKQDYAWGHDLNSIFVQPPLFTFPFQFWGRVRSSLLYSSLSRSETVGSDFGTRLRQAHYQNLALEFHPDVGVLLVAGKAGNLAAYATSQVRLNTLGEWWNNLAMAGPGLAYQPRQEIDFTIKAEYLLGVYFGNGAAVEVRPYKSFINDLRIQAEVRYDLGI